MKEKENLTKKYLSQIHLLDIQIRQKESELKEIRDYLENTAPLVSGDRVQTSPKDKIPAEVALIVDLEEQVRRKKSILLQTKAKIINEIQSLDNPLYIDILYKRYVEYKSLWEIAEEMGYSYYRIRHLHGIALQEVKNVLK